MRLRLVQRLRPGAALAAIGGTGAEQYLAMTVGVWLMAEPLRQPEGRAVGLSRGRWCSSPRRLAHMPMSGCRVEMAAWLPDRSRRGDGAVAET